MKQKKTTENYLKTVYMLSKKGDVHSIQIAESLGVSRHTVSVSLKALESEGYLYLDETKVVHLTEKGKDIAENIYERHKTLKDLLISLGVSETTAAKDACEMEHTVSAESFFALKKILKKQADDINGVHLL